MAVLWREASLELRRPGRTSALAFFAAAVALLIAFASPSEAALRELAGGTLWVALLLVATRSSDQSWSADLEEGALEAMVLWPVDPRALFLGKALMQTAVLLAVAAVCAPLLVALYDARVRADGPLLGAVIVAGCLGIAAPATLLGAITGQARGGSVLLPLLLFPLLVPGILSAARATMVLLEGDPMGQGDDWLRILLAFDAVQWSAGVLLFGRVVEEG
jgi:heme exporter protein B